MDTVDVVVAGGGLVGAALAYELAGDGARVALVDRHDPGRASDAGAGILSPETIGTPDPAWFSLAMAAGEHYRRLVPALVEAGAGDPGYDVCGAIRLAFREVEDRCTRSRSASRTLGAATSYMTSRWRRRANASPRWATSGPPCSTLVRPGSTAGA
jgi:glycine/D-amino acid oxidase-like deaminating enzyme